jgi:hypothetical protein
VTGSEVVRWRRLPGASTTAVHGLVFADGRRLVLRQYVWKDFLQSEPEVPGREVDVLRFVAGHGLPVPALVAADQVDGTPVLLMSFLPGRAVATPDVERLAEVAGAVHAIDPSRLGHDYFQWFIGTVTGPPAGAQRPELWERAIEVWQQDMPDYTPVLIHRDFHPGNVLWSRGRVTGIVDWANGCRGPVGCDVAHCRTNLIDWADEATADAFQRAYERLTGTEHHPFWEIASVLESHHRPGAEPRLEKALAALGALPSGGGHAGCTSCGFHWGAQPDEVIASLESAAARVAATLTGDGLDRRPEPDVWSPLEYAGHLADGIRWYEERIRLVLTEDRPVLEAKEDWDELTIAQRYGEQLPAALVQRLDDAAQSLARLLRSLDQAAWARAGIGSAGGSRPVIVLARRAAHEVEHHLGDMSADR